MFVTTPYNLAAIAHATPIQPPNPIYVDSVTGSNAQSGTAGSPVATLDYARQLCAGQPDWVIKVTAPAGTPLRQEVVYESTVPLTVEGVDDTPWYTYGSDKVTTGWSGAGPVYSRTVATVGGVTVYSMTEAIGGQTWYIKLAKNTATPTTPAAGEFGYTGGTLYVRLPDGSSANSHTFELHRRNVAGLSTRGFAALTVRDMVARHGLVGGILNGLSTQPVGTGFLVVEDSECSYNEIGVAAAGNTELTTCLRVNGWRNSNDGFNLHTTGGSATLVLNDCDGSYNGDAITSSQGASNHENSTMVINGGQFNYNVSGGMVVIDTARCDIHGDTAYGSVLMDYNMRLGNSGFLQDQAGIAWLNTTVGTVTGSVTVSNGSGRGIQRDSGATVVGIDLIVSTGNAVTPDNL